VVALDKKKNNSYYLKKGGEEVQFDFRNVAVHMLWKLKLGSDTIE
jgi:hypothetical protein